MTKIKTNRNNTNNVPPLRFPEFSGEWRYSPLNEYLYENKERNKTGFFNKTSVLSVSGDFGVVNQIQLLGRSFAGKSVLDYHVVRHGNIIYTKSPLKDFPYGIVKMNEGADGIVSTLYAVYNVRINASGKFIESYFALPRRANKYFKPIVRIGAKHDMKISNSEAIANIVCFPQYVEQQKIAKFLALIGTRIATQNKIIEKLETLIKAIGNKCLFGHGRNVRLGDILIERTEKSTINDQYEILSSTIKGIFSQRDYFSKDIASENNIGYKVLHKGDIVLSPQNLWMGNINYNDKFNFGIVSPSYKIFAISEEFDCHYVAFLLKTHRLLYSYRSISEQGASIVRRNLNMDAFLELTFKIPPFVAQRRIGQALSKLNDKIEMERDCLNMLKAQKQYLLSNLFI